MTKILAILMFLLFGCVVDNFPAQERQSLVFDGGTNPDFYAYWHEFCNARRGIGESCQIREQCDGQPYVSTCFTAMRNPICTTGCRLTDVGKDCGVVRSNPNYANYICTDLHYPNGIGVCCPKDKSCS